MTKVICSRYFPSRWKIGRRCSSRLFNAKARRVSAKETSRRCSKRWKRNRNAEAICKMRTLGKRDVTPHLNPLPSKGRGGSLHSHFLKPRFLLSLCKGRGKGEGLIAA